MPFEISAIIFVIENAALLAGSYLTARRVFSQTKDNLLLPALVFYLFQIIAVQEALGLFGILTPLTVFAASMLAGAVEIFMFREKAGLGEPVRDRQVKGTSDMLDVFFLLLVLCNTLLLVYGGLQRPPTDVDSVGYHLPIMATMLCNMDVINIQAPFGYYPGNSEILAHWFVSPFRDDILVGLQNLLPVTIGALSIYSLSRKLDVQKGMAMMAALIFLALPVVQKQLTDQENDAMMSSCFMAGIAMLVAYFETGRLGWLAAASLSAGLSLGTKYSGVYYLALFLAVVLIWAVKRRGAARPARIILVAVAFVLLGGGFWYLRNFFVYGSPVYPLGLKLFDLTVFKASPVPIAGEDLGRTMLLCHLGDPEVYRLLLKSLLTHSPVAFIGLALSPLGIWVMRKRSPYWWVVAGGTALSLAIFLITPLVVENLGGSMNLLKEGIAPARLGLPLMLFGCLSLIVTADALLMRVRHVLFRALLMTALFLPVFMGLNIKALLSVAAVSVLLAVTPRRLLDLRRAAAVLAALLLTVLLVVFGPVLMARKNSARGEVYGKWFPDVRPTGLYGFIDQNVKGGDIYCLWHYGVVSYAFWGPDYRNRVRAFPDAGKIERGESGGASGRPQFFVVTAQAVDRSSPDNLKFPEVDKIFQARPGRYRLVYQDHFAHVYKM